MPTGRAYPPATLRPSATPPRRSLLAHLSVPNCRIHTALTGLPSRAFWASLPRTTPVASSRHGCRPQPPPPSATSPPLARAFRHRHGNRATRPRPRRRFPHPEPSRVSLAALLASRAFFLLALFLRALCARLLATPHRVTFVTGNARARRSSRPSPGASPIAPLDRHDAFGPKLHGLGWISGRRVAAACVILALLAAAAPGARAATPARRALAGGPRRSLQAVRSHPFFASLGNEEAMEDASDVGAIARPLEPFWRAAPAERAAERRGDEDEDEDEDDREAGAGEEEGSVGVAGRLGSVISALLHADKVLGDLVGRSPWLAYAAVFAVVFVETGVVVLPFLPGDSLLFAAGALAGAGVLLLPALVGGVAVAAIAGDSVNYLVGSLVGQEALRRGFVRAEHVSQTEEFFDRHGVRAVALARFVPIVRTVVPFLAGVGSVPWGEFCFWNVLGGLAWSAAFLCAGAAFGAVPAIKEHMGLFTVFVAVASLIPMVVESRRRGAPPARHEHDEGPELLLAAPAAERS